MFRKVVNLQVSASKNFSSTESGDSMLSRRELLKLTSLATVATPLSAFMKMEIPGENGAVRCINVVNFIRGVEPRFEIDLLLPVQKQMEIIKRHNLPATWLLQFDAMVTGDFVKFLKENMPKDHEVGFWFEMNQKLCEAAGVAWRGRPGFEWDHFPPVAFTIGYTPEERIKLADAAMKEFKALFGKYPKSVASWNLDSITMAYLSDKYKVDAYAVCRDQIATDGFTIWGAPIAGYYPSKKNAWSPAVDRANQINTPVFRMLGQDPVHYYNRRYKLPDGRVISDPDTMEPVWVAGRSPRFIKLFLDMIARDPALKFAYAQLGQENSFPWRDQEQAYPIQMKALAELRDAGLVHVETMGDSGRRFKKAFRATPTQAQIMLEDSLGNTPPSTSVWYQSRFYRANLHLKDDLPFFRDITVYRDDFSQPYLTSATRQNDVEQRMPPVLDGYHWSAEPQSLDFIGAGGFFVADGKRLRLSGKPIVREQGNDLFVDLPLQGGGMLRFKFTEKGFSIEHSAKEPFALAFEWDPSKSALKEVTTKTAAFEWQECKYSVELGRGDARGTEKGWEIASANGRIELKL